MAQAWTTTELLEAIREDGRIPDDTPDATSAKLLRVANRIMVDRFVPLVRKVRAEFYVHTKGTSLTADRAAYDLPSRGATSSLRLVFLQDAAGNVLELTPLTLSDRLGYLRAGIPAHYTIENDQIILLPPPSQSAVNTYSKVYIKYETRPSTLVETSACGILTAKTESDSDTVSFTVANVGGGTFLSSANASTVAKDLVRAKAPFSVIFQSLLFSFNSGTGIGTFDVDPIAEDPKRGAVGDYMTLAEETPIPQLPPELHPALAYATIASWYEAIDPTTASRFEGKAGGALKEFTQVLTPRQQGRQIKARGSSLMRRHSVFRGRGGTFDDWT